MTPPPAAPDFLASIGWGDAEILPLAGDASFRRYFRVVDGERSAVLMDAPPPHEDPKPFLDVAGWLAARGFAAPVIHGTDLSHGLVLLQDFGDVRMRETVDADPAREAALYGAAIDLLVDLHKHEAGAFDPYDREVLHREVDLLVDWYCPAIGIEPDRRAWYAAWNAVFDAALAGPKVTVLRDYHAENLMLTGAKDSEGRDALGLLDFQDALAGHPAYDLVSLLQDARRDVPEATEAAMLARYHAATHTDEAFDVAYHVLGAQRNAKIVGIFTRLWKRDGKPRYPTLCPRVWRYLNRDLEHPALAPVKAWFDATIPADKRGDPMAIAGQ
ncbi:aminoglycoside phosphotransferase family protein [Sphingomonas immobilis]|uniref:Phosphotransferase n=1 Tax=Sphingomonas immobilis TaxID=3063997 RepID=A0ABT8ZYX4_9SPHN|nr:phosphotransferase [Sphingomonas sp. CA1-15]MDO7842774.1 phosphotransferase [Sphingomonas sp. CA1-15]